LNLLICKGCIYQTTAPGTRLDERSERARPPSAGGRRLEAAPRLGEFRWGFDHSRCVPAAEWSWISQARYREQIRNARRCNASQSPSNNL